jgi:hypothetical protein
MRTVAALMPAVRDFREVSFIGNSPETQQDWGHGALFYMIGRPAANVGMTASSMLKGSRPLAASRQRERVKSDLLPFVDHF